MKAPRVLVFLRAALEVGGSGVSPVLTRRFKLILAGALNAFILRTALVVAEDWRPPQLLVNAKVCTSPGQFQDDASILIDRGRIVAVGLNIDAPPDCQRLDCEGLVIYPGFIDAGSRLGIKRGEPTDEERRRLDDEIPDVRQGPQSATVDAYRRLIHPHWRAAELFEPVESAPRQPATPRPMGRRRGQIDEGEEKPADAREQARASGFTTALVMPGAAIFAGTSAVIELGDRPIRRSILVPDFAQHAAFVTGLEQADSPRVFESPRYPTTIMGAMAAFRQALLDARWHGLLKQWTVQHPEEERVPYDRDLEVLGDLMEQKGRVAFLANSENEIHRALDVAAEFDLKPMIVGAKEAWKVIDRLKQEGVPLVVSLNWSEEPKYPEPPKDDPDQPERPRKDVLVDPRPIFDAKWESQGWEPRKLIEERIRLWHEEVDNARRLAAAGVRFALCSLDLEEPGDFLTNLRKAIARGLPEEAARGALTRDAAALLGLSEQLGEISTGKLANLTVLSGPLVDEKSKVKWVFVEGMRFEVSAEGGPRRGRGGKRAEDDKPAGEGKRERQPAATMPTTASAPASAPASQPVELPDFACEIEADRKPSIQTGGNVLLRGATLLTVSGPVLPGTDLLVRDGRIAAIGKGLQAPAEVRSIDLTGYFICPGLIDPHSHMCSDGGLNEFSLSVTCEVRVHDVVNHKDVGAYRALAGGVTTIHTMHGSANTIGGQNATLKLRYGRPAAEWPVAGAPRTVKFALGENVKQSNDTRRGTRFPNTRMGVEAVLRRSFEAARAYQADWRKFEDASGNGEDSRPPRRDLRLEALSQILAGDIWVHCHCYRADEILRLLAVAETFGFRIAVLQHVLEGYRIIPEIHRHGCGASTFSDWWAYKLEAFDAVPHNAARLSQGGVVATINSDSAEVVRHLNLEAAKSMRFGGLDANEALRLATLNGAIQLGIGKSVGSLEVGKDADLAVFNGHPLDTLARCELTLIDGEVYFQHPAFDPQRPAPPQEPIRFPAPRPALHVNPDATGEYWIAGATVHPVSAAPMDDAVVGIRAGKLVYVGPRSDSAPPSGATFIDAAGLHIYPGLIDAAAQLGLTEIDSVAGSMDVGEIGDFQPDLSALSAYNPHASSIEVARCEGITSALILPQGGPVAAQAGIVRLMGWTLPESARREAVGLCVSLPSMPIRFPEAMKQERKEAARRRTQERQREVEEFFRRAVHYAKRHAPATAPPDDPAEDDPRLTAMIPFVRGERPVLFRADSYKQIREALEFARRFSLRPILVGGQEAWKLADDLARDKVDVIVIRSMAYPTNINEPWDSVYANCRVLYERGVRFCIATGESSLSKQLGLEAGMAAAHGLPADEALRAITLSPAQILGVSSESGSLDAGKAADLFVATASPLQASSRVVGLFISGRPFTLESRHTRMDDRFTARPAPALGPEPVLRGPPPMRR